MSPTVATAWHWIRHAPVVNPSGRIYGQRDVPADVGNASAFAALARRLPADAVWLATPLSRTQATAQAIRATMATDAPIALEADFLEQNFGDWQGRTYEEIGAFGRGPDAAQGHRFWLAPATTHPPGGESFVEVIARVARGMERIGALHAGRDIVVVAHGGAIRAALAVALGLAPEAALALSVDTLSLTRIDRIDGPGAGHAWRIGAVNLPAE